MLAARCRPASIVVIAEAEQQQQLRTPRFFALGDQGDPVRGVVVEEPAGLPAAGRRGPVPACQEARAAWLVLPVRPGLAGLTRRRCSPDLTIAPPARSG